MKTHQIKIYSLLLFILVGCIGLVSYGQYPVLKDLKKQGYNYENIKRVNTIQEFIQALGNNTVIIVDTGSYVFTDSDQLGNQDAASLSQFDTLSEYYDSTFIHDLENLIIIGTEGLHTLFLQPDGYNHVMKFRNIKNLYIQNLRLGHQVQGYCVGGVILMHKCENVILDNVELFGSGTEGLSLIDVNNVRVLNSLITNCSEQLSSFSNAQNIAIENCRFEENDPFLRGFAVFKSTITFENSVIKEKYPFYQDPQMYRNDYDVFFVTDYYDFGEWYIDRERYPIDHDLPKSVINFVNTTINDELVNCTYENVNNNDWIREVYGEEYVEEPDSGTYEDFYEEYYDEGYEGEYEEYYYPYEGQVVYIYLNNLTLTMDPYFEWYNMELQESGEIMDIYPALGMDPQGSTLRLVESGLKEIEKVEQQYETSLAIYEGENVTELGEWKHYTSAWSEIPESDSGTYVLPYFTHDESDKFPSFKKNELINYLVSQGYEEAATSVSEHFEDADKNWDIQITRISYKLTGVDENNNKVTRTINFWFNL